MNQVYLCGEPIPIPKVKSFAGLDEELMDSIYDKIQERKVVSYTELFEIGWCYKSDNENYKERQALLALKNLGLIKRVYDYKSKLGKRFHDEEWALQSFTKGITE